MSFNAHMVFVNPKVYPDLRQKEVPQNFLCVSMQRPRLYECLWIHTSNETIENIDHYDTTGKKTWF